MAKIYSQQISHPLFSSLSSNNSASCYSQSQKLYCICISSLVVSRILDCMDQNNLQEPNVNGPLDFASYGSEKETFII